MWLLLFSFFPSIFILLRACICDYGATLIYDVGCAFLRLFFCSVYVVRFTGAKFIESCFGGGCFMIFFPVRHLIRCGELFNVQCVHVMYWKGCLCARPIFTAQHFTMYIPQFYSNMSLCIYSRLPISIGGYCCAIFCEQIHCFRISATGDTSRN